MSPLVSPFEAVDIDMLVVGNLNGYNEIYIQKAADSSPIDFSV